MYTVNRSAHIPPGEKSTCGNFPICCSYRAVDRRDHGKSRLRNMLCFAFLFARETFLAERCKTRKGRNGTFLKRICVRIGSFDSELRDEAI